MKLHAIVCSYLGDGEVDIGKTATWLNNFVDTTFFYVLNYGEAGMRYSIDYAKTFPDAKSAMHPVREPSFFLDAPNFRRLAFEAAKNAWGYSPGDWVIFVDASESLAVDLPFEQLLPMENSTLFPYLFDEVIAATDDVLALPFFVFLNQGAIEEHVMAANLQLAQQIQAERTALEEELATSPAPPRPDQINARLAELDEADSFNNSVLYWTCDPHYRDMEEDPASCLVRMFQVDAAEDLDWNALDSVDAASSAEKVERVAIVSYSYARYVEGSPPPWNEGDDIGFANRLLMQQYLTQREVNLPTNYAVPDPAGVVPSDRANAVTYCYYVEHFDTGDGDLDFMQYTALWRQNPRDGVWYINYTLGPVPVDPLTGDPSVPPVRWDNQQTSTTGPPGTGRG